jgi:general secretion pathway protein G
MSLRNKKQKNFGFIPRHFLLTGLFSWAAFVRRNRILSISKPKKNGEGFTLIELLVVVAIIALLTSIALIGLVSAREKSRNVKRLADMTQMNTALELFNAQNKGYPDTLNGIPQGMTPTFLTSIPVAPVPPDGLCDQVANPAGYQANSYYYMPTGSSYQLTPGGPNLYPDYIYYFCLGAPTGNFSPGIRILTPKGVR